MDKDKLTSTPPDLQKLGVDRVELRLTIAVAAALIVQTGLGLIWAGGAAERIEQLGRQATTAQLLLERTARLEAQMASVNVSLARIENKLDHAEED